MTKKTKSRFGFVAIVGRPNVGKSTLLNALVGEKISIVSSKPHTTRHRILGVMNRGNDQAVFIDTPGHARRAERVLHRMMARVVHQAIEDCDLILLMIEARRPSREDLEIFEMLKEKAGKVVLVLNKIDRVKDRAKLLPILENLREYPFAAFVPISAKSGSNVAALADEIFSDLPESEPMFPREMTTDRDLRFRAAEIVREKLIAQLSQEVPYGLTVEVEHMSRKDGRWLIHALIWVEKDSQKAIVIGKAGHVLKRAGSAARVEISRLLDRRVHLELWVKVREHWSDSERELNRLGFDA